MNIRSARLETRGTVVLAFQHPPGTLQRKGIVFTPPLEVRSVETHGGTVIIQVEGVDLSVNYTVLVQGHGNLMVEAGAVLHGFRSNKPLGCVRKDGAHEFRVFSPRARLVQLHVFSRLDDPIGTRYAMEMDSQGVWELSVSLSKKDRYYAYSVDGPQDEGEHFWPSVLIADPYSPAIVSRNDFRHESRTPLPGELPQFDWRNDRGPVIRPEDLVVYELHVRDASMHPSSGVQRDLAGSYAALTDDRSLPLRQIQELGVNAVELLPSQQYAYYESPYNRRVTPEFLNTWNPYARNHWGYMTSCFFAPESRYASGSIEKYGEWNDIGFRQVTEFKEMVRTLHTHGIAVIMDVVYNHTSQYDFQPLKFIDRKYYFARDERGAFVEASGCGNDFDSTKPMARRLIVDSIRYWMEEYHIDGFRFDLAAMLDEQTLVEIRETARSINPDVLLIAEPWGGGRYDPAGFSSLDIPAWNDIFRNGIKGMHPNGGAGYVFGSWGNSSPEDFGKWMLGCTVEKGGPFVRHAHSVNYLESHDGYTLADFIRIATGEVQPDIAVTDGSAFRKLSDEALRICRLAAFLLFTARGAVMLQMGQEFGRSKVIASVDLPDVNVGLLDHNSYEKDDETNWIDWRVAELNRPLLDYYRGLIAMRARLVGLRVSPVEAYHFLAPGVSFASGFVLHCQDAAQIAVLVNPNREQAATYTLPVAGGWSVLVDAERAGVESIRMESGPAVTVPPGTAMLLVRGEY